MIVIMKRGTPQKEIDSLTDALQRGLKSILSSARI